jgi:membrane-bound ClpP family serine protease
LNTRAIAVLILFILSFLSLSFRLSWATTEARNVVLVRINSIIDYKVADLVDDAADDVRDEKLSTLLIELDSAEGYLSPIMQIANRLVTMQNVVVYVGPSDASATGYAAYVAIAAHLLAMNVGAVIGSVEAEPSGSVQVNYLMKAMAALANATEKNMEASQRMVLDNVAYSADEAYAKGICDIKVDSFEALLSKLNIDPQDVVEKSNNKPNVDRDRTYELLKAFADVNTIKYMFLTAGALVVLNFMVALRRPKKSKTDDIYRMLLDFMKMEIQSLQLLGLERSSSSVNETQLQTTGNIPSPPTFRVNRIPTPLAPNRLEKPLEVSKR